MPMYMYLHQERMSYHIHIHIHYLTVSQLLTLYKSHILKKYVTFIQTNETQKKNTKSK